MDADELRARLRGWAAGHTSHGPPSPLTVGFEDLLDAMVEAAGDGPILDAGCGQGHLTTRLAEAGVSVVAVESDPRRLRLAADLVGDEPGVRLVRVATLTALPLAGGAVAAAGSLEVLPRLGNADRAGYLAELRRVTRRGGRLVLGGVAFADAAAEQAARSRYGEWLGEAVYPRLDALRAAGLAVAGERFGPLLWRLLVQLPVEA